MNLDLNGLNPQNEHNSLIKDFMKELSDAFEKFSHKKEYQGEIIDDKELTPEEDMKFYRKKWDFLENYFNEELTDLSKGEVFIVTDKFENDLEYNRYKVTQYKNHKEFKYVTFEKDLPENVKLGDVVRKLDGKYILDEQATQYVNYSLNKIKWEIVNKLD